MGMAKELLSVTIVRTSTSDQGTLGYCIYPNGWAYSIELPWRDNQRSISCIPAGEYLVKIRKSPKYGRVYHVKNVPNRSWILFHSMNVAGDVTKGFKTESEGCLGLGKRRGKLWGQDAVLVSRPAMRRFMKNLAGRSFRLRIAEVY